MTTIGRLLPKADVAARPKVDLRSMVANARDGLEVVGRHSQFLARGYQYQPQVDTDARLNRLVA